MNFMYSIFQPFLSKTHKLAKTGQLSFKATTNINMNEFMNELKFRYSRSIYVSISSLYASIVKEFMFPPKRVIPRAEKIINRIKICCERS